MRPEEGTAAETSIIVTITTSSPVESGAFLKN